ncbi:MAG: TetR/AcrR family transcriptional regulator [Chitinivibrionales bacterium]|nr:TetR/AcrR family transcriptional regulator [Chitinivibrionales bacterium]
MPRTSEQFEEMREKSRAVIQAAALKLFARQGFHGTTIKQIVQEAKVAGGLIYNYYPSKEALMLEIIDSRMGKLVEALESQRQEILFMPTIRSAITMVFQTAARENAFWRLMIQINLSGALMDVVTDGNHRDIGFFYRFLVEILTELYHRRGSADATAQANTTAQLLHGAYLGYLITNDEVMFSGLLDKIFA